MNVRPFLLLALLAGCSSSDPASVGAPPGGNDDEPSGNSNTNSTPALGVIAPSTFATPSQLPDAQTGDSAFASRASTARFLTQASFGPREQEIDAYVGKSESAWFRDQLAQAPSQILPRLNAYENIPVDDVDDDYPLLAVEAATMAFWRNAGTGGDQLRQRIAFALSQILVVSNFGGEVLTDVPHAVAYTQDILINNAFGNYRTILEQVTYSPAMGHYLTYMGNEKANPVTGRRPDENYAREVMQLFSIGVVLLQQNGEPVFDAQGDVIETYTNTDITELAKVFTGLNIVIPEDSEDPSDVDFLDARSSWALPMVMAEEFHSTESKSFLGQTIAENTRGTESIRQALDILFGHQNVGPFIGRQLIQRLVTSNPTADYIERVAQAFDRGTFTLPDGTDVGTGERGDLSATVAAILFDPQARDASAASDTQFGKPREPVIRLVNFMRAFNLQNFAPEYIEDLYDTLRPDALAQHPYRAKSVFNFYRPGYVPTSTLSGSEGMTVPEFQIVNATSAPGYVNFMSSMIFRDPDDPNEEEADQELDGELEDDEFEDPNEELLSLFENSTSVIDYAVAPVAMVPDYSKEVALGDNLGALVDRLDELLVYGSLPASTKNEIIETLSLIDDGPDLRTRVAVLLIMTSPEYLIQR